jgi:hypothetical protein
MGLAAAGLAVGHWTAYAIATPVAHERDAVLHATGHGYLPFATQVAVLAGALGLAVLFLARLTTTRNRGSFARDAAALVMAQSGAYLAIEIGERLLAGASLHDLTHGSLLAIGLGVQVVVACGGAWLMHLTDWASEVATSLRSTVAHPPALFATAVALPGHAPARRVARTTASRGPPAFP